MLSLDTVLVSLAKLQAWRSLLRMKLACLAMSPSNTGGRQEKASTVWTSSEDQTFASFRLQRGSGRGWSSSSGLTRLLQHEGHHPYLLDTVEGCYADVAPTVHILVFIDLTQPPYCTVLLNRLLHHPATPPHDITQLHHPITPPYYTTLLHHPMYALMCHHVTLP